jgi:hypothetical protein
VAAKLVCLVPSHVQDLCRTNVAPTNLIPLPHNIAPTLDDQLPTTGSEEWVNKWVKPRRVLRLGKTRVTPWPRVQGKHRNGNAKIVLVRRPRPRPSAEVMPGDCGMLLRRSPESVTGMNVPEGNSDSASLYCLAVGPKGGYFLRHGAERLVSAQLSNRIRC